MKSGLTALTAGFTLMVVASIAIIGTGNGRAQPPANGSLGDCHNPSNYGANTECVPTGGACALVGACREFEDGYDCPGEDNCGAGGCLYFKATSNIETFGFCEYNPLVTTACKKCDFLACASGNAYKDMMACMMNTVECGNVLWWQADACKQNWP